MSARVASGKVLPALVFVPTCNATTINMMTGLTHVDYYVTRCDADFYERSDFTSFDIRYCRLHTVKMNVGDLRSNIPNNKYNNLNNIRRYTASSFRYRVPTRITERYSTVMYSTMYRYALVYGNNTEFNVYSIRLFLSR